MRYRRPDIIVNRTKPSALADSGKLFPFSETDATCWPRGDLSV